MRHHVYLSPGMFGFGKLGSYDYFAHVEHALVDRFAAAGHELFVHSIDELPTASIRRRATRLAEIIAQTTGPEPIHLLGHSTGGLDARLVASPATRGIPAAALAWLPRLRSVTTMNTPHFGTPLATYFATSNGQHVLAALSILTVAGLSLGAQPLAAASVLLGFVRGADRIVPFKFTMLDRAVGSVVALVDDARSPAVRKFLDGIEDDQGSMLQLSAESMDLVVAGFADRDGVAYQSTISMSPSPTTSRWIRTVGHPWRAVSLALFFALHRITSVSDKRYPCAAMRGPAPWAGDDAEAVLARAFATAPLIEDNDGVVPIRSQIHGRVIWAGLGDHLDVLGHYPDLRDPDTVAPELRHRDWLASGSDFGDAAFGSLMDAVANGMLAAT